MKFFQIFHTYMHTTVHGAEFDAIILETVANQYGPRAFSGPCHRFFNHYNRFYQRKAINPTLQCQLFSNPIIFQVNICACYCSVVSNWQLSRVRWYWSIHLVLKHPYSPCSHSGHPVMHHEVRYLALSLSKCFCTVSDRSS